MLNLQDNSTPKKQKDQKTPKKESNGTPAKPDKKGESASTPMKGDKTPKKEKDGKGNNTPKLGKTPKRYANKVALVQTDKAVHGKEQTRMETWSNIQSCFHSTFSPMT